MKMSLQHTKTYNKAGLVGTVFLAVIVVFAGSLGINQLWIKILSSIALLVLVVTLLTGKPKQSR